MSKQSLTREEIAYLLRGTIDGPGQNEPRSGRGHRTSDADGAEERVSERLDHCERVAERLDYGLGGCWQQTAAMLAAEFSTVFRASATVEPQRDRRATQGQFLLCCHQSACLFRLGVDDSEAPLWLSVDLPLMFSLLDRLLGGHLAPHRGTCRPLTELESGLATRVVGACTTALQAVWPGLGMAASSADAACRIQRPWLMSGVLYACCEMHVRLGEVRGAISLAIPWQLARQAVAAPAGVPVEPPPPPIALSVILGRTSVSTSELATLAVGDLIPTEQRYDRPLEIELDGQVRYRGRLGTCQGRKAIRIE